MATSQPAVSAADLAGLLSEPDRLRVVAALALGATTLAEVAERTDLDVRAATRALNRLQSGGLVSTAGRALVLNTDLFKAAARASAQERGGDEPATGDPGTDAVLRAFVTDGRVRQIPAAWGKRRKLLEHIVMIFEPGVRYPEPEVNAMLRAWHPDYAALRRYLVDEELLSREAGEYWRSGGPVVV